VVWLAAQSRIELGEQDFRAKGQGRAREGMLHLPTVCARFATFVILLASAS
jgi:hypothetical protein